MKYITQAFLYVFELFLAISIMFCIGNLIAQNKVFAWTENIISYDFLGKFLLLYGIYQIAIFVLISLFDSARRDATLNKIKIIKLGIVRSEFKRTYDEMNVFYYNYKNNNSILINKTDKNDIEEIYQIYRQYIEGTIDKEVYDFYLKNKLVLLEDKYEFYNLAWRLSLILRLCK
ncbi:hypothetical protein NCCP2222_18990 [Sporosarcina sp. NCCP-2222]|uniref:hypothetical protein n=1 Tax=Sporosarcina sp. NCCP-2222 TaxID=2935073 RepID=UPI00208571D0|nr:hypothetical protein [Sporosarcina sp. NCCP-2222]GKV55952.1 hypothetical protein NCCP2222_18990 [Sporosarcina sp. NCCP-2222]